MSAKKISYGSDARDLIAPIKSGFLMLLTFSIPKTSAICLSSGSLSLSKSGFVAIKIIEY